MIFTAEKRMFAKTIVLSDAFLDMPMSARCLYFTLGMLADDDGFVNAPKSIMRQCGASNDDMKMLLAKRYILSFDTGVIVIKHWRINNYLRNDRYTETSCTEEKATLTITESGEYESGIPGGIPSIGIPSIDKNSIDKNSIDKNRKDKGIPAIVNQIEDDELKDALNDFIDMRKKIKKPLTERALKIILTKLDDLASDPHTQSLILLQSVEHCWQTVYELKTEQKTKSIIDEWENA